MMLDSLSVEDIMTPALVSVAEGQSLHVADAIMSARGLRQLSVVNKDNFLLGLISHRDIVAALREGLKHPVESIMATDVVTLTADMSMRVATGHVLRSRHEFAPVLRDTALVGVLTEDDMLALCMRYFRSSSAQVSDIMTRELVTAKRDMPVPKAMALMESEDVRHLLIANPTGLLEGVTSQRDLLMLQRSLGAETRTVGSWCETPANSTEGAKHPRSSKQGALKTDANSFGTSFLESWTLQEVASKDAWTTTSSTPAAQAAQTLRDNHFGCLPVVESKHLLGIITLGDFLRRMLSDDATKTPTQTVLASCGTYASKSTCRVAPEQSLSRALQCFSEYNTPTLLVVEGDIPVGILSRTDILKALYENNNDQELLTTALADFMSRDVVSVAEGQSVHVAAKLLMEKRVHQLVVEHKGGPPNLFGRSEILRAVTDKRLKTPLSDFMTPVVFSIDAQESLRSALRYLRKADLSGIIVHDGEWPVGVFGQPEALESLDVPPGLPVETRMCSRILCLPKSMPASRAAQQAEALGARHVIVVDCGDAVGLATATDFAGLLAS